MKIGIKKKRKTLRNYESWDGSLIRSNNKNTQLIEGCVLFSCTDSIDYLKISCAKL